MIGLLKTLHLPDSLVEKIKQTPPTAGVLVITLLLYKVFILITNNKNLLNKNILRIFLY